MPDAITEMLEPGMRVHLPSVPEWGVGQVQSRIGMRVTVNFQHGGKQVIDARVVAVEFASEDMGRV